MYTLLTLGISLIPFAYYYYKSFSLSSYFKNATAFSPMFYYLVFCFTFIFLSIILLFADVISTSHNKDLLFLKEQIGLFISLIFILNTLIIFPFFFYLQSENTSTNKKLLIIYYIVIVSLNIKNLLLSNDEKTNNYGFGNNVPEELAMYSFIDSTYSKIVYYNFGLLVAFGKFLGFTYMPYGMSRWVSPYIFQSNTSSNESSSNSEHYLSSNEEETEALSVNNPKNSSINFEKKTLNQNSFSVFKFLFGIFSFLFIVLIIFTKIQILYTKVMYNICGIDCGLLAYRFDNDVLTLESIINFISHYTYNKSFKIEFFVLAYVVLFRMITTICSMKEKGVAFLSHILVNQTRNMSKRELYLFLTVIIYTGIVLLYDFTYLLPDYMRFNNLDPLCDYSIIAKPYCGVSYFGLLFIKISMNYHVFMIWDIIASLIFITNSSLWAYRLIIHPGLCFICSYC